MRLNRRHMLLIPCAVILSMIGTAAAADYWPLLEDETRHYATPDGEELTTYMQKRDADSYAWTLAWQQRQSSGVTYVFGEEDDIVIESAETFGWSQFGDQWFYESMDCGFPSGAVFLDLPLITGTSWDWRPDMLAFFEVSSEETITTPFGTFDTQVVTAIWLNIPSCDACMQWTLYLDRDLGPIRINDYELKSIDGYVANETMSFSALKRLYR